MSCSKDRCHYFGCLKGCDNTALYGKPSTLSTMDTAQYQRHGREMVDYIAKYLETIRERRVFPGVSPGYMKDLVPSEAPEHGEEWEKIISDVEEVIMPGMTHWQSPHMHAYFPATHSYPALLGDMLADGINAIGFTWASSPACTELEIIVMDWLGKMIGLPAEFLHSNNQSLSGGGGVIQTTASEGTFVAMLAARTEAIKRLRSERESEGNCDASVVSKLVAYCSEQAHSSVEKASLISLVKLRLLPTDENHRLRGDTLREAILEDRKKGLTPFYLCATLGTTGCCSFDSLTELGPICEQEGIWLHVDAAYAGSAFICPEFRHFLDGVEYAQSFVFNPSKWLLVNFDCTAMWVKNSGALHCTFNVEPLYLQHENSGDAIDYMHWQIPLSRRFRALKLWFVMRSYGVQGLQKHIRDNVALGKFFEELVRSDERFEIPASRHLGLIVFRLKGNNQRTERLLTNLNRAGKVHMVPASLKGVYVIRFTITSTRTTEEDLVNDWMIIQEEASRLIEIEMKAAKPAKSASVTPSERYGRIKRRYTWSYNEREWDVSLLLSNVPDKPSVVNGTFAAICDWKDLKNACSTDDMSQRIMGGEDNYSIIFMMNDHGGCKFHPKHRCFLALSNGQVKNQNGRRQAKRVLSMDTGFKVMKAMPLEVSSLGTFGAAIDEVSSSSSSDELCDADTDQVSQQCERVKPPHVTDEKLKKKNNIMESVSQLLEKLPSKVLRKVKLMTDRNDCDVIPSAMRVEEKQERNGRYGVEG